jgi:hypothetical protein
MMRSAYIGAAVVLAITGLTLPVRAELVENPMYAAWARFAPGSRTTLAGTVTIGAVGSEGITKMDQTVTYELIEVTPEQVVLRVTTRAYLNGRQANYPPQRMVYPALAEKGTEGVLSLDDGQPDGDRTLSDMRIGNERIDFQGEMAQAVTREYTTVLVQKESGLRVTMTTKAWYLPQVPGGLVRIESTGTGPLETSTRMRLSEWHVPRPPATAPGAKSPRTSP